MNRVRSLSVIKKSLAVAALMTTLLVTSEANAGFFNFGRNPGGRWGGGGSGGSSGGGVPEIDAGSAAGALTLLVGGVMMLRDRYSLRSKRGK